MRQSRPSILAPLLALCLTALTSGCGLFEAGEDEPFILPLPAQNEVAGGGGSGGACSRDLDCRGGERCNAATQRCETIPQEKTKLGADCTKNSDCGAGEICDSQTRKCAAEPPTSVSTCTPACGADERCNATTKRCEPVTNLCPPDKCASDQVCNPSTGECLGGGGGDLCAGKSCPAGQICNPRSGACEAGKTCPVTFTGHLFLEMKAPPGANDPSDIRTQNIPLSCPAQAHIATGNPSGFKPACCCHGPSGGPFTCDVEPQYQSNYRSPYPFDPAPFCQEESAIPNPPSVNAATIRMTLTSPNAQGEGVVTLRGADMADFMIHDRTGNSEGDFIINGGEGITAPALDINSPSYSPLFSANVLSKDDLNLKNVAYTGSYTVRAGNTIDLDFPFRFRVRVFYNNTNNNNNLGTYVLDQLADDQVIPPLQDPAEENLHLVTTTIAPLARLDRDGQPTDETLGGSGQAWGPDQNVAFTTAVVVPRPVSPSPDENSNLRGRIGGGVLVGRFVGQFDKTAEQFLAECRAAVEGECDSNRPCPTGQHCVIERKICEADTQTNPCGGPCPAGQTCNVTTRVCETPGGTDRCAGVACGTGATCNPATGLCEAPPLPPTLVMNAVGEPCNGTQGAVPFTTPNDNTSARQAAIRFCSPFKFYKDGSQTSTDATRYEQAQTVSIRNDSQATVSLNYAGGTVGPFVISPLATTLGPADEREARLPVTFKPQSGDSAEVRDVTKIGQICDGATNDVAAYETTLQLASSPPVSLTLQGCARKPAAILRIVELAPTAPYAERSEVTERINFGEVVAGQSSRKLLRYSNIGVKNLTIDSLTLVRTGLHYQLSSVRQGFGFASTESAAVTINADRNAAGPFVTMTPDGQKDVFVRISYAPLGTLGDTSADHRDDNASLVMQTNPLGAKTIAIQGSVSTSLTAIPELWYENTNITTASPDRTCLNNEKIFRMPSGTTCGRRECNLLGDTSSHRLFIRNGKNNSGADYLHVTGLSADDTHFVIKDLNGNPLDLVASRFDVNPGECKQIGTITFVPTAVTASNLKLGTGGGRIAQGVVTLQSRTVKPCSPQPCVGVDRMDVTVGNVTTPLIAVNGAPHGRYTLHISRMVAGLPSALTQGSNRLPTTMTPGQANRADRPASEIEHFKIHASLDAARGTIALDPVFTTYTNDRNAPPPLTGIRLYNGPGAGGGPNGRTSTVFRYECLGENMNFCPFFFIDISGVRPAFANAGAAVYTGYTGGGRMLALDPSVAADAQAMQADPSTHTNSLIGTTGIYDPISGEITFANNIIVRLFSDNSTVGVADSTLPLSLTTGCLGPTLVPSGGSDANIDVSGGGVDTMTPPLADIYGPNPIRPYASMGACQDASDNPVKYLKGRPLFTSDTTGTLDLVNRSGDLDNLTIDLAGIARTKSNVSVGHNKLMYLVVKVCLESDENSSEPGAARGSCNTCPSDHGNNATSPTGQCTP